MPSFNNIQVVPTPVTPNNQASIDTASVYQGQGVTDKLTTYIEGSPYRVTYYNRYIGGDDTIELTHDVHDPTSVQYQRIRNFELRLQDGAFNTDINTQTLQFLRTGTANVYPVITPQVGDVFTASVDVNRLGIFSVTAASPLTHLQSTAYQIEFSLTGYHDTASEQRLEARVVTELVFDAELIGTTGSALQTESEFDIRNTCQSRIAELVACLYHEYFDIYLDTFVIRDESCQILDPFAVRYFNCVIPESYRQNRDRPQEYDIRNICARYDFYTIWDALRECSKRILDKVFKQTKDYGNSFWGADFVYYNLDTSQIDLIIYPDINDTGHPVTTYETDESCLEPYVFSDAYYQEQPEDTWTETDRVLYALFENTTISYSQISDYIDTLATLTTRERFYGYLVALTGLLLVRS